jgi:predicted ABC-type ATPase
LFFWLDSVELAISRVETRVKEGGHSIPEDVIRRRYTRGLENFFKLYIPQVNHWIFVNNSGDTYDIIAEGFPNKININNYEIWEYIKENYHAN